MDGILNKEVNEELAALIYELAEELYQNNPSHWAGVSAKHIFETMKNYVELKRVGRIRDAKDLNLAGEDPRFNSLVEWLLLFIGLETVEAIRHDKIKSWHISPKLTALKKNIVLNDLLSPEPAPYVTKPQNLNGKLNREGKILCEAMRLAYIGERIKWNDIYQTVDVLPNDNQRSFMREIKKRYAKIE